MQGEVEIKLGGIAHTLRPTLDAFQRVAALGAYTEVVQQCMRGEANAVAAVCRAGLGWSPREAQQLPELVFKTGLTPLGGQCAEFVFRLFNNGRNSDEVVADLRESGRGESGGGQGNGQSG